MTRDRLGSFPYSIYPKSKQMKRVSHTYVNDITSVKDFEGTISKLNNLYKFYV